MNPAAGAASAATQAFTDLSSLNGLKGNNPENLRKVAQQFESMFVDLMLRAARQATDVFAKDNPLESFETGLHREMLDHQLAMNVAQEGGIGLAPVILRQWEGAVRSNRQAVSIAENSADSSEPRVLAQGIYRVRSGDESSSSQNDETEQVQRQARLDSALHALAARVRQEERMTVAAPPPEVARSHLPRGEKAPLFSSPTAFVRGVFPVIERVTAGTDIDPLALLAHAALETGWGREVITDGKGGSSHNLFGIKANRWQGPASIAETIEVQAGRARRERESFRVYDNIEASIRDVLAHLQQSDRYTSVVRSLNDPRAYARALGASGYATDPRYTGKLLKILNGPTLNSALKEAAAAEANHSTKVR